MHLKRAEYMFILLVISLVCGNGCMKQFNCIYMEA